MQIFKFTVLLVFLANTLSAEPVVEFAFEGSRSSLLVTDHGDAVWNNNLLDDTVVIQPLDGADPISLLLGEDIVGLYVLDGLEHLVLINSSAEVMLQKPYSGEAELAMRLPHGVSPLAVMLDSSDRIWVVDASGLTFGQPISNPDGEVLTRKLSESGIAQVIGLGAERYVLLSSDGDVILATAVDVGFSLENLRNASGESTRIVGVSNNHAGSVYLNLEDETVVSISQDGTQRNTLQHKGYSGTPVVSGGNLFAIGRQNDVEIRPIDGSETQPVLLFSDPEDMTSQQSIATSKNGRFLALTEGDVTRIYDVWDTPDALTVLARNRAETLLSKIIARAESLQNGNEFKTLCATFLNSPQIVESLGATIASLNLPTDAVLEAFAHDFENLCGLNRSNFPTDAEWTSLNALRNKSDFQFEDYQSLGRIAETRWMRSTERRIEVYVLELAQRALDTESDDERAELIENIIESRNTRSLTSTLMQSLDLDVLQAQQDMLDMGLRNLSSSFDNVARRTTSAPTLPVQVPAAPETMVGIVGGADSGGLFRDSMGASAGLVPSAPRRPGFGSSIPSAPAAGIATPVLPSQTRRVRDVGDVLPRNGLYVRRNNQYGADSPRISEALKRGVLVEQDVITFDDFVGVDLEGLPSRQNDQLISISAGVSEIPVELRRDSEATHFVEIVLRSRDERLNDASAIGADANYVFAVDRSGSMSNEIDRVRQTIFKMYESLADQDAIGIVAFDDGVSTILEATKKVDISPQDLRQALNTLSTKGGTDINLGLGYGFDELGRFDSLNRGNHLVLLSDGEPTSGVTDWFRIRSNVAESMRATRAQITAFAIGAAANFDELDSLVGGSGGRAESILTQDDIDAVLTEETLRQRNVAAMDVQIQLILDEPISLRYIYGHEPITDPARKQDVLDQQRAVAAAAQAGTGVLAQSSILSQEEGIKVFVPNLSFGESYILLLEVALPDGVEEVLSFQVQFVDVPGRQAVKIDAIDITRATSEITAESTAVRAFKLASSEIVFAALNDMRSGDRNGAIEKLQAHGARLRTAAENLGAVALNDDSVTLSKFVRLLRNVGTSRVESDYVGNAGVQSAQVVSPALSQFATKNANFLRFSFISSQD